MDWNDTLFFQGPYELQNFCREKVCECTLYDWQGAAYFVMLLLFITILSDLWRLWKRGFFAKALSKLKENDNAKQPNSVEHGQKIERPKA